MREITRASAWGGFAELVAELGGDAARILATAQVDSGMLADPERYLPLRAFVDSQAVAAEWLKRKDFGLLFGQRQSMSMLGALSIAIMNSPTARAGIEIAARFMHVHNPALTMTLAPLPRTSAEFLSSNLKLRDPTGREQNDERILSNLHKSLGELSGGKYRPASVHFTHAPMSPMSVYRRVFGITPLFEQPAMGIAIDRSVLDLWLPGGSEQMRAIAETFLARHDALPGKGFTKSVASMARSLLRGGEFTPEQTAKALGLHARTLQRRLRNEGSSFEKIKDDARREWAQSLLVQPAVPLTEIAQMLGYADSSAFSRSCRRWFGEAPRTYRTRLAPKRGERPGAGVSRVNSLTANVRALRNANA